MEYRGRNSSRFTITLVSGVPAGSDLRGTGDLLNEIGRLIEDACRQTAAVNVGLTALCWQLGNRILRYLTVLPLPATQRRIERTDPNCMSKSALEMARLSLNAKESPKDLDLIARCVGDQLGKSYPFVQIRLVRLRIPHIHGRSIHLQQVGKADVAPLLGPLVVDIQDGVRGFRMIVLGRITVFAAARTHPREPGRSGLRAPSG